MKIREIPLSSVLSGKTWRLAGPWSRYEGEKVVPLEDLGPVEEVTRLNRDDFVIYSAVVVLPDDQVRPILMLKELASAEYGDYLEFSEGKWGPVRPEPGARRLKQHMAREYVANPDPRDPRFDASDSDLRQYHRDGFKQFVGKVQLGGKPQSTREPHCRRQAMVPSSEHAQPKAGNGNVPKRPGTKARLKRKG